MSWVYFIKPVGMEGPIKIGFTWNPPARLQTLMRWSPFDLEIVATTPGSISLENQIQCCFAHVHLRNEWFKPIPELVAAIAQIAAGTPVAQAIDLTKRTGTIRSRGVRTPEHRAKQSASLRRAWARKRAALEASGAVRTQ